MKKLLAGICALAAVSSMSLFAQDLNSDAADQKVVSEYKGEKASWPVWLAFNDTSDIDVVGLRVNIPYGACEDVTGIDLGFLGRCRYMYGLQLNILRNDITDFGGGVQVGIYNSIGRADEISLQVGLWNEANRFYGFQAGLINICDEGTGFQIGIINRAETIYGFQIGIANIIRESEMAFCPIVNIGFDVFPNY